jgi:hypothetical protein
MNPVLRILPVPVKKFLGKTWRSSFGRWVKRVDFWLLCHDLSGGDVPLPTGRHSPIKEGETFVIEHATHAQVETLTEIFDADKVKLLHTHIDHPEVDMVVRMRDDGPPWCYMLHSAYNMKDPIYGFTLPLVTGRDILQFDGWVDPDYRGLMIGILGTNSGNKLRRAEGFERAYATVRHKDRRSWRLHKRMGFIPVGEICHLRFGPFKFNRVTWKPGMAPHENRDPNGGGARLYHPKPGQNYEADIDRVDYEDGTPSSSQRQAR